MNFRKKILLSFVLLFLIFATIIYPISSAVVKNLVFSFLSERANEVIAEIDKAPTDNAMVQLLKDQQYWVYFRVSLITEDRKVLYDSFTRRLLGPKFDKDFVVSHPEVEEAFKNGYGAHEDWSEILGQYYLYIATHFESHGKPFVLRVAFPWQFVDELSRSFELALIILLTVMLLLFSVLTWFIFNYLTRPIQNIITTIKPYQEGVVHSLPTIEIAYESEDDFSKLANTLNSLGTKIQSQINSLTLERTQKETILESLVEGVIAVDNQMRVTYANHSALLFFGAKATEITDHPFSSLHQKKAEELLQRCQKENTILDDHLQIDRDGKRLYLDIVAAPQKNKRGGILVLTDKSEHYRLLEMRKDFIANASHELKTPITIIRGFAETLEDHPDLPYETRVSITGKIMNNCKRMATLIRDLLTLTDIENIPESRLIECDVHALVKNCMEMVQNLYPEANMNIENKLEKGYVRADSSLLELAVMNLIENAAKYSNKPAHISINLENSREGLKLIIADKGIGIPASDVDHIFERFYTVNKSHSRKLGGSGLGLSIVKTIVEKHFGNISVASQLGEGTTFTVQLPLAP
jgi:two-component system phosphate regulon sensor histidine kinase PhoR